MTSEVARRTVDWFMSRAVSGNLYHIGLTFFGGEPFMALPRMAEMVAYARQYRPNTHKAMQFYATTNGTIADGAVERLIKDAAMRLIVSLDGDEEANAHRPYVSGRPSYPTVTRNLRSLLSWAPDTVARITWHPDNLDLVRNVEHALDLGATMVGVFPVVEADWAGLETRVDEAWDALADWYIQRTRQGRLPPLVSVNLLLSRWHASRRGVGRPSHPCGVGRWFMAVDPEGRVMPCHRFYDRPHDHLGTVENTTLSADRDRYLRLSTADILGCDGCEAAPVCGGGCRVLSLMAGQGLAGRHPAFCMLKRAEVRAAQRIYRTLMADDRPDFHHVLCQPVSVHPAMTELH
jgi:radical SAM protein with 4Fe4S-binding SPASM domain